MTPPLVVDHWETPASAYPRRRLGEARVGTSRYARGFYRMHGVAGPDGVARELFRATRPLRVTELRVGGKTVMVDDPLHWYSVQEHAREYAGHVLCAGLGLGLVVHALRANPAVTSVTVVEREPDVIALVGPAVAGPGIEVVRGDWWDRDWEATLPPVGGVFFDLLVGDGRRLVGEAFAAMTDMRRRWPGVRHRVFGMNSQLLCEMAVAVESGPGGEVSSANAKRLHHAL